MNYKLRIRPNTGLAEWDVLIVALGYEARATFIARSDTSVVSSRIALAFETPGQVDYDSNKEELEALGFKFISLAGLWEPELLAALAGSIPAHGVLSVAVDISCLTRSNLASLIANLCELAQTIPMSIDFLYAPASSEGWIREPVQIEVAEPVHPAFVSWADDPTLPLAAVIGVGAEDNLALGVAEYLDVSSVYAMVPFGSDPGFDRLSKDANRQFFVEDYVLKRSTYDVLDAFQLYGRLEALTYGLENDNRVALVPLGPKIFALCAILVSATPGRQTTVWRFSSGTRIVPRQRVAAGPIVTLRVELNPT